jgi:hypothetical protein
MERIRLASPGSFTKKQQFCTIAALKILIIFEGGTKMKSSIKKVVIAAVLIWANVSFSGTYGGGSGVPWDPYQIWTAEQMNTIGANPGDWWAYFKLMDDVNMALYTGTQYNIIGNTTTYFSGNFDGNFKVISNLTV